jgi:membrane-associated phospholipid phosphatase
MLSPASYLDGIRSRAGRRRPLLAGSARPLAGVVLTACTILIAMLGVLFSDQSTATDQLDRVVDSAIITRLAAHQGLVPWLAAPGSQIPAAALSAVIVAGCLFRGRLNGALLAAAAVPAAVGLNDGILKHLVHRTSLGELSYPSGHTASMSALAATVTVLLLLSPRPTPRALRALLPMAAWLLTAVVAVGVIALRWHYLTDTLAGAALGGGTVCALALLIDMPVRHDIPPENGS